MRLTFEATDETVVNAPAKLPLPVNGGVMRLGGEVWTVVEVRKTDRLSTAGNSVYRFSLVMSTLPARRRLRPDIDIPDIRRW